MTNLFGEAPKPVPVEQSEQQKAKASETEAKRGPLPAATPEDVQALISRAIQEFEDYQRLTSQGKLGEAGQKLEQHKRTLEQLRKATSK